MRSKGVKRVIRQVVGFGYLVFCTTSAQANPIEADLDQSGIPTTPGSFVVPHIEVFPPSDPLPDSPVPGNFVVPHVEVFPPFASPPISPTPPSVSTPCTYCLDPEENPMGQVRSVTELSDIRPTDWAYSAIQTLRERYGVMQGYPDGTFQGDRPLNRYEFAVVLNQILDKIKEQLETGELAQLREDLTTVKRLQAAYGEALEDLKQRMADLENRAANLEQRQFSVTTRLSGQAVGVLTDGTDAIATLVSRVRLDFKTSFTGRDTLRTQLEAGNEGGDAISQAQSRRVNLLGTEGILADGGGLDYVGFESAARISKLYYTFQPTDNLSLTVGARLSPRDFIDYNRFANDSTLNFSSSFFANNPLIVQNAIDRPAGVGAALSWKPSTNSPITLRAVYAAADTEDTTKEGMQGELFSDRNQGSVELEYNINNNLAVRLQYTKATINDTDINAGGINAEWSINRQFGVFGRVGFGSYDGFNSLLNQDFNLHPWTWMVGANIRNIVIPGSTAGLAIGQPFVEPDLGNATQTNVEAYYSFLLNDNVSFSPGLLVTTNPNNNRSNTIWQWFVRMVFSF
jgi:hypothetical protein